jgi:hypothetical protein
MVNDTFDVKLIDFGLCIFETIGKVQTNFISEKGTMLSKDWGTYCICPPESFLNNMWSVEKFMQWSVGITLCEFLFQSHSVIYNCVMTESEKKFYRLYAKNDEVMKNVFGNIFRRLYASRQKHLMDFHSFENLPEHIACLLEGMLTLNYKSRASIDELLNNAMFNRFKMSKLHKKTKTDMEAMCETICNQVDAPICDAEDIVKYKLKRAAVVEWMFEMYTKHGKLHLFTQAINVFDMYCSKVLVQLQDLPKIAAACLYIVQYISKNDRLRMNTIIYYVNKLNGFSTSSYITNNDINTIIDDILTTLNYNIYRQTFDLLLAKQGLQVDLCIVLNILINNIGPYDNASMLNHYISLKY